MTTLISYTVEEVQRIAAAAYQRGLNAGYMLAVQEEVLELEAMKREQEREAIINWLGLCESGQVGECSHDD